MVFLGLLVAMVSLYQASMRGVYGKMGFDENNYINEVDMQGYASQYQELSKGGESCDGWQNLYLSTKIRIGQRDFYELVDVGRQNFVCGVYMVSRGNVKRGMFNIIKSQRYLIEARLMCGQECGEVERLGANLYGELESLEMLSSGRVKDTISAMRSELRDSYEGF